MSYCKYSPVEASKKNSECYPSTRRPECLVGIQILVVTKKPASRHFSDGTGDALVMLSGVVYKLSKWYSYFFL